MHLACLGSTERAKSLSSHNQNANSPTALPRCQWLLLTAWAEFKGFFMQSKGINGPRLSTRNSCTSFAATLYDMQSEAVIMFMKAKPKNQLVPLLLAVRQHVRPFVLLPGKSIYLLSIGGISSSAVYWESHCSTVICLNLY